jgi:hypothetical protein
MRPEARIGSSGGYNVEHVGNGAPRASALGNSNGGSDTSVGYSGEQRQTARGLKTRRLRARAVGGNVSRDRTENRGTSWAPITRDYCDVGAKCDLRKE